MDWLNQLHSLLNNNEQSEYSRKKQTKIKKKKKTKQEWFLSGIAFISIRRCWTFCIYIHIHIRTRSLSRESFKLMSFRPNVQNNKLCQFPWLGFLIGYWFFFLVSLFPFFAYSIDFIQKKSLLSSLNWPLIRHIDFFPRFYFNFDSNSYSYS